MVTGDYIKGEGQFYGYLILRFTDKSALSCKFLGEAKGTSLKGEILELTGLGKYEEASGKGSLSGKRLGFLDPSIGGSVAWDVLEIHLD